MPTLRHDVLSGFADAHEVVTAQAQTALKEALMEYFETHRELFASGANRAQMVRDLAEIVRKYTVQGAKVASSLSAKYYDYLRAHAIGTADGYTAKQIPTYDTTGTDIYTKDIAWSMTSDADVDHFIDQATERLSYDTKRAQGRTVYRAGQGDPRRVRYARVTAPGSTCKFCLMLASRGFEYRSNISAGGQDPDHYHANCRCMVVPNWSDKSGKLAYDVEGYDPDTLREEWRDSGHADYMARRDRAAEGKRRRARQRQKY